MRIRLLRPLNSRMVGTILDVPDGVAELWILQRKAERIIDTAREETMVPERIAEIHVGGRRGRRTAAA